MTSSNAPTLCRFGLILEVTHGGMLSIISAAGLSNTGPPLGALKCLVSTIARPSIGPVSRSTAANWNSLGHPSSVHGRGVVAMSSMKPANAIRG